MSFSPRAREVFVVPAYFWCSGRTWLGPRWLSARNCFEAVEFIWNPESVQILDLYPRRGMANNSTEQGSGSIAAMAAAPGIQYAWFLRPLLIRLSLHSAYGIEFWSFQEPIIWPKVQTMILEISPPPPIARI